MLYTAVILVTLVLIPELVSAQQNQNGVPTVELEIRVRSNNRYQGTLRILIEDDIEFPMVITVELPFEIGDIESTISKNPNIQVEEIEANPFSDILQNHTLLHVQIEDSNISDLSIKFPITPLPYHAEEGEPEFRRTLNYSRNTYLVLEERYAGAQTLHFRILSPVPEPSIILVPSKVILTWDDDIQIFEANRPNEAIDKVTKRITTPGDFFEGNILSITYFLSPPYTEKIIRISSFTLMLILVGLVPYGLVSMRILIPSRKGRIGVSIFVWLLAIAVTMGLWNANVIGNDQIITLLVVGVASLLLVIIYITQHGSALSSTILQEPDSLPKRKNEDELTNLTLSELQELDKMYQKHLNHLLLQRARQGTDVKFETQENIEHLKSERAKIQNAIDKILNGEPMADPLTA